MAYFVLLLRTPYFWTLDVLSAYWIFAYKIFFDLNCGHLLMWCMQISDWRGQFISMIALVIYHLIIWMSGPWGSVQYKRVHFFCQKIYWSIIIHPFFCNRIWIEMVLFDQLIIHWVILHMHMFKFLYKFYYHLLIWVFWLIYIHSNNLFPA